MIYRVMAKQGEKREQTHHECLHAMKIRKGGEH